MARRTNRPGDDQAAPEPGAASVSTDASDAADMAAGGDARSGRGPVTRDDLPLAFRIGDRIFNTVLVVLVFLLVVTVGYNVFGRYVLGRSLAWADEGSRYLFIWVIFIGAGLAHWRDEHIAVEFFTVKLPLAGRVLTSVIKELIILFVLGVMLYGAMNVLRTSPGTSPLLNVPYNVINAAVPAAAVLMVPMSLYRIVRTLVVRDV